MTISIEQVQKELALSMERERVALTGIMEQVVGLVSQVMVVQAREQRIRAGLEASLREAEAAE